MGAKVKAHEAVPRRQEAAPAMAEPDTTFGSGQAVARAGAALQDGRLLGDDQVLGFQTVVGNWAVQRLLQRKRADSNNVDKRDGIKIGDPPP